jgi:hypothetical protein
MIITNVNNGASAARGFVASPGALAARANAALPASRVALILAATMFRFLRDVREPRTRTGDLR